MNPIYNLMSSQGNKLIEQLTDAGLDNTQAEVFLPDALKSVMLALEKTDVQTMLDAQPALQVSSLMEIIDVPSLAYKLDGNIGLASKGLQSVITQVFGFLKSNPAAAGLMIMRSTRDSAGQAGNVLH